MSEKDSKYYDDAYSVRPEYSCNYNESYYIFVWRAVVAILEQYYKPKILELGCGTGQFAHFLEDNGFIDYLGCDFSKKGIEIATNMSNQKFFVCDIKGIEKYNCEVVVCLEVLEHIEKEIELIKSIPKNTDIIFTVPTFGDPAHLRFFKNKEDVINRYDISYSEILELKQSKESESTEFILCRGYNDK